MTENQKDAAWVLSMLRFRMKWYRTTVAFLKQYAEYLVSFDNTEKK